MNDVIIEQKIILKYFKDVVSFNEFDDNVYVGGVIPLLVPDFIPNELKIQLEIFDMQTASKIYRVKFDGYEAFVNSPSIRASLTIINNRSYSNTVGYKYQNKNLLNYFLSGGMSSYINSSVAKKLDMYWNLF